MEPAGIRAAIEQLAARDPGLGRIEALAGPLPWRVRPAGFPGLLQSVTGQQISSRAAGAIWARLRQLPGALDPAGLLAQPPEALRGAGLSARKTEYARALAEAFLDGRLSDPLLAGLEDEAAIRRIAALRGFGRWTAETHLLFGHGRPDVFPAADLALAASLARLRGLPSRPTPDELLVLAEAWRPYRAVAARLLWHHWSHVTGQPSMDDLPP